MRPGGIRRLFRLLSRSAGDVQDDVRQELAFHVEERARDLVAEGVDPGEARARAVREFGDVSRTASALTARDAQYERQRFVVRIATELRQDAGYASGPLPETRGSRSRPS